VVAALDREISGGDLRKAGDYLADDFQFVGVAPAPLNRDEALALWQTIRAAMPDFNHNMKNQREAGNMLYATVEVTGTQTGTFQLPDGGTIAPTGRTVRNPVERIAITVRGNRAVTWEVEHVPGGGFAGVLGQIS
jgi:hypothetical protein